VAGLGSIILVLTLVATTYSAAACVVGARRGNRALVDSGIGAAYFVAALMTLATAIILHAFVTHDYSIKYVQHYSDATMPLFYKLTSYWGGLDGSLLFWAWLLTLFSAVAIWINRDRHRDLIPYITAVLMGVTVFFLVLLVFMKNPFDTYPATAPLEGKGLNPLLQNPYMATHPPSLYIGFVGMTIPYAFGMAALITGNLDDAWLLSVRRWVLVAWLFNAIGLGLGSLWAYEVLGWGGYWAWDPVENAGFLPWLTATAFLHSVMVQERRGMLKKWNLFLVIITFMLTIVGTMMTRSGIVQSVHAFGEDNQLLWMFLGFLTLIGLFSFGLLVKRLPLLRSRNELESWMSREFAFVVNNWILLVAAVFVFFATMFPTISEKFVGNRITVGPPFFNQWMIPIGLILLFLTGVGPLIAWRRATSENLRRQFTNPVCAGLFVAVLLVVLGMRKPLAIVNFGLCGMVMATIFQEFYRGAKVRQKTTNLDLFTSLVGLVARGRRRYGGYLVHIGMVLMFLGWGGDAFQAESEVSLKPGQQMELRDYTVRFNRLVATEDMQKEMVTAEVTVLKKGKPVAELRPGRWFFKKSKEDNATTQVEIRRSLDEDLYVILGGFEMKDNIANIKVTINPLVNWIWLGFGLLFIGTLVALSPERVYAIAGARVPKGAVPGGPALVLLFGASLLLLPGTVRAQGIPAGHEPVPDSVKEEVASPLEREITTQLVCMCGTCTREVIGDCRCGYAAKERAVVKTLLKEGKTKEQVIEHFRAKYPGDSALIVPPDVGFNRLAWAVPYGLAFGGAALVLGMARRLTRRSAAAKNAGAAEPADQTGIHDDKLDEELRNLD
jgi:cytochrome c-type biogenesis protein CcmF